MDGSEPVAPPETQTGNVVGNTVPDAAPHAVPINFGDLAGKKFLVCGDNLSGKTVFCKWLIQNYFQSAFIYDYNNEYESHLFNRFVPRMRQNKDSLIWEFDLMMRGNDEKMGIRDMIARGKIDCFLIEEANLLAHGLEKQPLSLHELNEIYRHYNQADRHSITLGYVTRRPQDISTNISELCHYIFIFNLVGRNSLKWAEDMHQGLSDAVRQLPAHGFVVKKGNEIQICRPVPLNRSIA